jgi:UDP-N-acetylmuramate--alanine ligase
LVMTEIYSAGECPIVGVKGETLAKAVESSESRPGEVHFIPGREEIVEFLEMYARPGDLVITCGAGDISQVGKMLAKRLPERWAEALAAC